MKQTCNGCRAYEQIPGGKYSGVQLNCSLRYVQVNGKPQEECPKPKTIKELVILSQQPKHLATVLSTK